MNLETWRWFINHLKPHRWYIGGLLFVSVLFGLVGIATPLILQRVIDTAVEGRLDVVLMTTMIALFFASSIPLPQWMRGRLRARFTYKLRGNLLDSLLRMDMSFHDDRGSTKLTTQTSKGVAAAANLLNLFASSQILLQLPVALFAVYYLGQHNVVAVSILIGFLIVFGISTKALGKKIATEEEKFHDIDNDLTHRGREAVHQIQTVKVNHTATQELAYYWTEGKRALFQLYKLINLHSLVNFMGGGAHDFSIAVVVLFFIPQLVSGDISVGTFFALLMFAGRIVSPAHFFSSFYTDIKEASALLKPVMEILDNQPRVVEQQHPLHLNPVKNAITVRNLTFQYPGSDRLILKNVSVTIPAKKKTAIVGRSGSGKSTLARLLTRLYDPTDGLIEYDGTDLRNVSFVSLYGEVTYLTQEVPIFTGTVVDNVTYGCESYDLAQVNGALLRASAEFVHQLEGGLDTKVGELGKKLSGGERQRIAIARLFMRNPSVVILDEATSALDNLTEAVVIQTFEQLGNLNGGKTMVVIAHRLSTVQNADQIIVMDDGCVLDAGTHQELLERCEFYRQLNTTLSTT